MQSDYITMIFRLAVIKKLITNDSVVLAYTGRNSLVLVSPSKEILSIHISKHLNKSGFGVCVSDLLYSQYYQRLLQCQEEVLDKHHPYSMSIPSSLFSHIQILVM